jgi:hypothetical protein
MAMASNAATGVKDLLADGGDTAIFLRIVREYMKAKTLRKGYLSSSTLKEFGNKIGRPVSDLKEGEVRTAV